MIDPNYLLNMNKIFSFILITFITYVNPCFGKRNNYADIKECHAMPIRAEIEISEFFFYYILNRCDEQNILIEGHIEKELNYLSDRIHVLEMKLSVGPHQ